MLVLTRRINETIRINNDISIKVLDIRGNQVRIGFDAPRDVAINREEIWVKIQEGIKAKTEATFNGEEAS